MTEDISLLKFIIDNHEFIRDHRLEDHQVELYKEVERSGSEGLTSSKLAKKTKVSIVQASTLLRRLYEKGFLLREKTKIYRGNTYTYRVKVTSEYYFKERLN